MILCEFHIMVPNPTHLSVPLYLLSALLVGEAGIWHNVSVTQHTLLFTHLANAHCNESLILFKTSGFCYIIYPVPTGLQASQISMCPLGSTVLRCPHGLRWQPRPGTSTLPLVVTWATDIDRDPSCSRTMDLDMTLGPRTSL